MTGLGRDNERRLKLLMCPIVFALVCLPAGARAERERVTRSDLLLEDPVNIALEKQKNEDLWDYLSESDVPWIRAAAALHFIGESDPDLRAQGTELASALLATSPRDTHTLLLLFDVCNEAPEISDCSTTDIGTRLIESAPDNGAFYLKVVGKGVDMNAEGIPDTREARQALWRAADAGSVDDYYGQDSLELYRVVLAFENEYQPTHEPAMDMAPHSRAFSNTWYVNLMQPLTAFVGLAGLCQAQIREERADYIEPCLALARNMQERGKSLVTRSIGYGLERRMLDAMGEDKATVLYVYRKQRMSTHVSVCQMPNRMKSGENWREPEESEVIKYLTDLGTAGEIAAIRNQAIRGYEANPEDYEQDPLACEALMDLDSESMGRYLGDADPKRMMETE